MNELIFVVLVTTGDYPEEEMTYNAYVGTDARNADAVAHMEANHKRRGIGNSLRYVGIEIWKYGKKLREVEIYS